MANRIIKFVFFLIVIYLISFVVKTFVAQVFYLPTNSMEPALKQGDRVLVWKWGKYEPKRGDIVVYNYTSPEDSKKVFLIKRITALAGETIKIRKSGVYINGKKLNENPFNAIKTESVSDFGPFNVPKDTVFVLGDNIAHASDSRQLGPVPLKDVVGKMIKIISRRKSEK